MEAAVMEAVVVETNQINNHLMKMSFLQQALWWRQVKGQDWKDRQG